VTRIDFLCVCLVPDTVWCIIRATSIRFMASAVCKTATVIPTEEFWLTPCDGTIGTLEEFHVIKLIEGCVEPCKGRQSQC